MTAPDLPPGTRERLTRIFAAYPELREVVLYGSRATGTSTPRSDIDLATRGITDHRLGALALDLEESDILQKCDVRAYESIESAALRDHIEREGVAIYRADAARAILPAMKAIDAAYEVLREADEPLGARELSDRMLDSGLWATKGKTPWSTVAVAIQADIKENGERSRFLKDAPGIFALNPAYAEPSGASPNAPLSVAASSTATATQTPGPMSFLDAAERILHEAGHALHYKEIAERAISQGLIKPGGATPARTLTAVIGQDIAQCKTRGEPQRFVRFDPPKRGYIGLADPLPKDLAQQIIEHNAKIRAELLKRIKGNSAEDFEKLVADLLENLGFESVDPTPLSNDGGIDVYCELVISNVVRIKLGVQAKLWKGRVGPDVVRNLRGSLGSRRLAQGIIVTISEFTDGAYVEEARGAPPITLVNGEDLVGMLVEHGMGAKRGDDTLWRLTEPGESPAD